MRARTATRILVAIVLIAALAWLAMTLYGHHLRQARLDEAARADLASESLLPDPSPPKRSDVETPIGRLEPVDPASDRGLERLYLNEQRCQRLPKEFQAKVVAPGECEVYVHDLRRDNGALVIMASPRYGVRSNGRPVSIILPDSAYKNRRTK